MDKLTKAERSALMARIRGNCLRPEAEVKAAARRMKLKFTANDARLPGRPDLAVYGAKLAVFVDGCFWHQCPLCFRGLPLTNRRFWLKKLAANVRRDRRTRRAIRRLGWRTITIRECRIGIGVRRMLYACAAATR